MKNKLPFVCFLSVLLALGALTFNNNKNAQQRKAQRVYARPTARPHKATKAKPAKARYVRRKIAGKWRQVRVMPTNLATGGTAFASSSSFGTPADNAFDGNESSLWVANAGVPQLIGYDRGSGNAVAVTSYKLRPTESSTNSYPVTWTFEGSNDGSSYSTLDTQSGISWALSGGAVVAQTFSVSGAAAYRYHRLNITATNGGSEPRLATFEFYNDAAAPPTITSTTPTGTQVGTTAQVVLTGTNFTGATDVEFAAINVVSYNVDSATQITLTLDTSSPETSKFSVTTPDGQAFSDTFAIADSAAVRRAGAAALLWYMNEEAPPETFGITLDGDTVVLDGDTVTLTS